MDKFKIYLQEKKQDLEEDIPSKKVWTNISHELQLNAIKNTTTPIILLKPKQNVLVQAIKYMAAACIIALAGIGSWHLIFKENNNQSYIPTTKNQPATTIKNTEIAEDLVVDIDTPFNKLNFIKGIEKIENSNVESQKNTPANNYVYTAPLTNNQTQAINNVDENFNTIITLAKNKINHTPIYGENASFYNDFLEKFKQMENDEKQIKKDIAQQGFDNMFLDQLINIYQQKLIVLKLLQTEINKTNSRFKQNRNAVDTLKANYLEL